MPIVSRQQRVHMTPLTSALLLISTLTVGLTAQTRQVSVESFVYDLKHPDAVRRQTAVRELGANRYRAAIPQLIPLTADPVAAVRRGWQRRHQGPPARHHDRRGRLRPGRGGSR